MKSKYLITIAIPTYNSRTHIDPLLLSFKKIWNHQEIMIIFFDDASSDGTVDYIKQKTSTYNNVQVSAGRKNIGIGLMRGKAAKLLTTEWMWYIDSDDNLINVDKIDELISTLKATKSNVLEFKYIIKTASNEIVTPKWFLKTDNNELLVDFNINDKKNIPIGCLLFNKIIHSSILSKIKWYDTYNEDAQFIGVLYSNTSFTFYNRYLYSYNRRYNSLSNRPTYHEEVTENIIIFLNYMLEENLEYRDHYIVTSLCILLTRLHRVKKSDLKKIKLLFKEYKNNKLLTWHFSRDFEYKLLYILLKMNLFCLIRSILLFRNRKIFRLRKRKSI